MSVKKQLKGILFDFNGTLFFDTDCHVKAFEQYYNAYVSLINTIASTYYGNVKKDVFYARVRKYDSALDMALMNEDVCKKVYENLIKTTKKALPKLHKYMAEKKKLLGLKKKFKTIELIKCR